MASSSAASDDHSQLRPATGPKLGGPGSRVDTVAEPVAGIIIAAAEIILFPVASTAVAVAGIIVVEGWVVAAACIAGAVAGVVGAAAGMVGAACATVAAAGAASCVRRLRSTAFIAGGWRCC